ncbi:hypothetical protein POVWA2_012810 [Plasmodium ovale wallikeri]|uniref:Uncharacterized protein n=1 Tax=Plasmodium ovale wallikeri TaxID=864142 RepID=A0A1A8YLQ9_PLAOA|nr:hypothetical protein POVWA1_012120 [Plasmodium ovale wallikeri]SBT33070.1 hypothetical protein POVWA2_012810 [Plasmodium ovale wallikeri]
MSAMLIVVPPMFCSPIGKTICENFFLQCELFPQSTYPNSSKSNREKMRCFPTGCCFYIGESYTSVR